MTNLRNFFCKVISLQIPKSGCINCISCCCSKYINLNSSLGSLLKWPRERGLHDALERENLLKILYTWLLLQVYKLDSLLDEGSSFSTIKPKKYLPRDISPHYYAWAIAYCIHSIVLNQVLWFKVWDVRSSTCQVWSSILGSIHH